MSHSSSSTSSHGSVKSYVTGLLLSLVLTVIPFAVVMSGALSTATTVVVIAITAVLQILVQLVMFMHMNMCIYIYTMWICNIVYVVMTYEAGRFSDS